MNKVTTAKDDGWTRTIKGHSFTITTPDWAQKYVAGERIKFHRPINKIRIGYIVLISGLIGALIALKLLERGM